MATAQDVIGRARQLINDVASTFVAGLRWSDTELMQWLTDGQREIVRLKPEANPVTDILDVTGGFARQRLSPELAYRIIRVEANGTGTGGGGVSLAIRVGVEEDGVDLDFPSVINMYTMSGWVRYSSHDDDYFGVIVEIEGEPVVGGICKHRIVLSRLDNQLVLRFHDPCGESFEAAFVESPPPNQWFFFAITLSGISLDNQLRGYWALIGENEFAPDRSVSLSAQAIDMQGTDGGNIMVGSDRALSFSFDGDLTQIRQWTRVLDGSELIAEKNSRTLVSTDDVFSSNPLQGPDDMSDESGNGATAGPRGALTSTDGPTGQT